MFIKICECIVFVVFGGGYCLMVGLTLYYLLKGIIELIKQEISK